MQDAERVRLSAAAAVVDRSDDLGGSVVIGLLGQEATDFQVRIDAFLDPAKYLVDITFPENDRQVVTLAAPQRDGEIGSVCRGFRFRYLIGEGCRPNLTVFQPPQPAGKDAVEKIAAPLRHVQHIAQQARFGIDHACQRGYLPGHQQFVSLLFR